MQARNFGKALASQGVLESDPSLLSKAQDIVGSIPPEVLKNTIKDVTVDKAYLDSTFGNAKMPREQVENQDFIFNSPQLSLRK